MRGLKVLVLVLVNIECWLEVLNGKGIGKVMDSGCCVRLIKSYASDATICMVLGELKGLNVEEKIWVELDAHDNSCWLCELSRLNIKGTPLGHDEEGLVGLLKKSVEVNWDKCIGICQLLELVVDIFTSYYKVLFLRMNKF